MFKLPVRSSVFLATLCLAACDKGGDTPADTGAAAATAATGATGATAASGPKADADEPAVVDEALMAELKAIAANCEVKVESSSVSKCKNEEDKNLRKAFRDRNRVAALDTFSAALSGDDPALRTVAATMSGRVFNGFDDTTKVGKGAAKRFIAAVGGLEKYQSTQAVRTAVNAATLAKTTDELYAMIDAHSYKRLAPVAYRELMLRGRTAVLPKLIEVAKGGDTKHQAAALAAPRRMSKPTDAERKEVCAWTDTFIESTDAAVYEEAGHDAIWCGGASIDKALARGEARLADGSFDRTDYMILRDVCFKGFLGTGAQGDEKQCARTFALLQSAVDNEALEAKVRSYALDAIYYQRRDAETLKLMKVYSKSKVPELKKRADEKIESLKKHYKIE